LQIAKKLSSSLGRKVVHVKLTEEQRIQKFLSFGMPEHYAKFLTFLEGSAAKGEEERMNDAVERVTGRPSQNFDSFAQQHKMEWH
jgi:festuclavine dehydrogenase